MWRQNAWRTGATVESLPENLALTWVRNLPKISPAFHSVRLQFDAGYEPVAAHGKLLIASSRNDSVTAYDAATGREVWVFRTDGPIRFAPAVWKDAVCFGSDDGCFYCVDLADGQLRWKHRVVPSDRRLLGNGRLISVWPIRGGPVVAEGYVYFAAGVWPFEGVFVCAMNIATGKVVWRNERLGYLFGQQPHDTKAIGGLAPQGYLIVNGDELIIPCSTAYPARLNRETGELIEFELPAPGGLPGGWFASLDAETSRAIRRGKLTFDDVVNSQLHEDKVRMGKGSPGISRMIRAGDRTLKFDAPLDGVKGTIHSMIVADKRLYVSTRSGTIYCFSESPANQLRDARIWKNKIAPAFTSTPLEAKAEALIQEAGEPYGIALVAGFRDGTLVKALLAKSSYHVIAIDDNPGRVEQLRQELQRAGLYGTRTAVIQADPAAISLPPYLAKVITTETPDRMVDSWSKLLPSLRPYGGVAAMGLKLEANSATAKKLKALESNGLVFTERNEETLVRRVGALPGSAQYQGGYEHCEDTLVRFPLGVLWFDDTLSHFKRSPQPHFMDGVMVSRPKDWQAPRVKGDWSIDYPLREAVLSDMYTGRILHASEASDLRKRLPDIGRSTPQPSYYHAPHQKTYLNPDPPLVGERINPLTGLKEPRAFPKTYGCDGGVDYGLFYTLRSGTAAFYDKTLESGTVFISGPRSGCSNSIIPSGGLLNVPYFYEGCTCSYPLPSGLAMFAMPETYEQWASWGADPIAPDSIQRIGLNFGAPGDRKTRDGTLWLDYPSVGGPSPKIRVETSSANPTFHYRHSLWMNGGEGWPWVGASAVEGLRELTLRDLKPGSYTIRLHFAEREGSLPGARRQSIFLQGQKVLIDFDILTVAKQPLTGVVREIEGVRIEGSLTLKLEAAAGATLISGIELIRNP